MADLLSLTKQYVARFSIRDLAAVGDMLVDDFILQDPDVKRVIGKEKSLEAIAAIFRSCDVMCFSAKNILIDGSVSVIEFELKLDEVVVNGVDIVEWDGDKITEVRAYLDV
jgi:hypothetical protein